MRERDRGRKKEIRRVREGESDKKRYQEMEDSMKKSRTDDE